MYRLPIVSSEQTNETTEHERFDSLRRLVDNYEPSRDFILLVSVHENANNVETTKMALKFLKIPLRLPKSNSTNSDNSTTNQSVNSATNTLKHQQQQQLPLTLILTGLSKPDEAATTARKQHEPTEEDRQLFLANLLNEFEMRGVNVREKYPTIYQDLCLYVEENRPFTPVCLFARDQKANSLFMCLIMPNSEPVNYPWLYNSDLSDDYDDP
jgi:hypothetical protein